MDFGIHIGARGAADNPDGITTIARHCEALGYAYLGVSDHVIISRQVDSHYPYNPAGIWPGTGKGTCLEQLTVLAYIAAVTERIRLLTSVMVLPYRPPVQTAKMLASVDVLSNGRLTVGAGTGWNAEEMIALGSPPFDRRGKASNEYLDAFLTLWTRDEPTYAGEFVSFDNVIFEPKPVQDPHPPIWIGGEGPAARRRAGRFGDGWYPVGRNPNVSLETPELFTQGMNEVRRHAETAGRDPTAIDTAMSVLVQPLVQAIASGGGISQTADGSMSVTATWGLGESIAQGEVVPDRYDLSEDGKLVDMQTGRKSHTIHCTHHAAPTTKAVAEDEVSKPCLSDAQAEELGAMMKVAEDLKGGPVEIEWAMDDAGIKMLQARPLHTEAAPVPDQIWERHPGMKGQAAGVGWGTGRACVINCECELGRVAPGDVLVTKVAGPAISQVLPKVSGVVTELGGSTTHLASLARERGIPMVLGVLDATNKIPDGGQVAVDGVAGVVRWVPA